MKKIMFILLTFIMYGCGATGDSTVDNLGNDTYQIQVRGWAGTTLPEKVSKSWYDEARKVCQGREFVVLDKTFTGPDKNGMLGTVKCK